MELKTKGSARLWIALALAASLALAPATTAIAKDDPVAEAEKAEEKAEKEAEKAEEKAEKEEEKAEKEEEKAEEKAEKEEEKAEEKAEKEEEKAEKEKEKAEEKAEKEKEKEEKKDKDKDGPATTTTPSPTPTPTPSPTPTTSTTPAPSVPDVSQPEDQVLGEKTVKTRLRFHYSARREAFVGKVTSQRKRCNSGRVIRVLDSRKRSFLGRAATGRSGKWALAGNFKSGSFQAKVSGKTFISKAGDTVHCSAAKTKKLQLAIVR